MAQTILDSREQMRVLDKENVLGSVEQLPNQIEHVWGEVQKVSVPESYKNIKNVVANGMGGSGLGAHVIQTTFKESLHVPLEVFHTYDLPAYVNQETLAVLSSYSGSTEEILESAKQAKQKNAKIMVIASGGPLLEMAQQEQWPAFKIDPKFNPSNQPRTAIGYSVFGQIGLFHKAGLIDLSDEVVKKVVANLRANAKILNPESIETNTAKLLAFSALDKVILLISAEHLEGAVHVFNNQLNENAKNLTMQMVIPELNHHAMEGLGFPKHAKQEMITYFFTSQLYHPRVQRRFPLTIEVIEENGYQTQTILAVSKTKLEQVWEVIQLGAYTNFYLAMLNGVNPAPIPWVDAFKEKMGK